MSFRPVVGLYRRFYNNEPLPNAVIKIKPTKNDFDLEAGYPVEEKDITTDVNGELPADLELWANEDGFEGSQYTVTEPDGHKWQFILPAGVSAISIQELRANGQPVNPPDTVISLIENTILNDLLDVDFGTLLEDDVPAWDATAGKFVNRPRGSGGGGGGVTSVALALASSLFNVSGSPITTNGTLTGSLKSQTQNQVFAAPDGADGVPAFRLLAAADIPNLAASKITSGTFGTTRLADNAVTFAKLQNIATARLLGRSTAATGSVEEISIGSGLSLAGGVLSASGGGGGGIDGSGTANKLPKFSDADTIADSAISDNSSTFITRIDNRVIQLVDGGLAGTGETFQISQGYATHFRGDRSSFTFGELGQSPTVTISASATNIFASGSRVQIECVIPNYGGLDIKAAAAQSEKLVTFKNSSNAFIGGFAGNGAFLPASLNDSDAPNSSLYYSLDSDRLTYKDGGGTPHSLW